MGSVHRDTRTKKPSWRVAYTKPDGRGTTKSGFRTRREAEAFLATTEVSKLQGSYIAPSDARVTLATLGEAWLAAHRAAVKDSTYRSDESAWRVHVKPQWGTRAVGSIRHSEVATWVAELSNAKSPTTVKRVHGVLAAILGSAVRDRRIPSNPARDVRTPRKVRKPRAYLTLKQVERLAEVSKYPGLIRFLAFTGLRWGEATGLTVKRVDTARRRVEIMENAVMVGGQVIVGTPKTHHRRSVPYPDFLDDTMAAACAGKDRDALLFPSELGGFLRPGNGKGGWFRGAVMRAQASEAHFPHVTPHDLRHTTASLAISTGANVKAVQRMLGHASAAMTLDVYADLFDDDLDTVAEALSKMRAEHMIGQESDKGLTANRGAQP